MPDFASVAACLSDLTKKTEPKYINWTDIHKRAFEELKSRLLTEPILRGPDPAKQFQLQPFKFETKHRRGVTNGNADGLSKQAWNERLRSPEGGEDVREIDPDIQE